MIICSNCESAQCLQIVQSRVFFENGEDITEIEEDYECTLCGGTGRFELDSGESVTIGDIEETADKPVVA